MRTRQNMIDTIQIDPNVASYCLLSLDDPSIGAAIEFIFEKGADIPGTRGTLQHPFVPYLPEGQKYNDLMLHDSESALNMNNEVCFICQQDMHLHFQTFLGRKESQVD